MQRIRLTEKRYPIAKFLIDKFLLGKPDANIQIKYDEADVLSGHQNCQPSYVQGFIKEFQMPQQLEMLTDRYAEAISSCYLKLMTADNLKYLQEEQGVLLSGGTTIVYKIFKDDTEFLFGSLVFRGDELVGAPVFGANFNDLSITIDEKAGSAVMDGFTIGGYFSSHFNKVSGYSEDENIRVAAFSVMAFQLFKRFYEKQEKETLGSEKRKLFNCQYKNDLGKNVVLYDSKDLYNLTKGKETFVRRHWRWQVCGEGFKDRKLIQIDPHVRNRQPIDNSKQDAA